MAKKVAGHKKATAPPPIVTKKSGQRFRQKLTKSLGKIVDYMRSDTYMFSPLVDPPNSPVVASSGEGTFEEQSMIREEKSLKDEYLKCDFHMYAPLAMASAPRYNQDPSKDTVEAGEKAGNNKKGNHDSKLIALKQILLQRRETVKRVVHQNGPSSNTPPGKVASRRRRPHHIGRGW